MATPAHRYRCHQCYGLVAWDEIVHVDMYSDLCWIQCSTCAAAFGRTCGLDRRANPDPHGYFNCPLRPPPVVEEPSNVRHLRRRIG